jgi:ParB family chromosome partitioning protein
MATTKKKPLTNRKPATKKGDNEVSSKKIFEIPVSKIEVENGFNKRLDYGSDDFETLKHSIKRNGVQEPIRVVPHPTKKDHYILREGHRRMKAVELINKATGGHVKKVLAMVSTKETKEKSLIRMISANSGKSFSKIERGFVCIELKNNGWSVNQIAEETGIPITDIYFCMSLTELPKKYHMPIAKGELSAGKLKGLFKEFKNNPEKAEKIVDEAVKRADKEEVKNEKEGKVSKKVKQVDSCE